MFANRLRPSHLIGSPPEKNGHYFTTCNKTKAKYRAKYFAQNKNKKVVLEYYSGNNLIY